MMDDRTDNIKQPNYTRKTSEENQQVPPGGKKPYFALYVKTPKGSYLTTVENCVIALENDPNFKQKFGFDVSMWDHVVFKDGQATSLTDELIRKIWLYMMRHCALKLIKFDHVHQAIMQVAEKSPFNPIKDYFDSLVWDGIPRLDDWLIRYFGAKDNQYNKLIGKLFMLSIAARALRPGCQQDHILVLEGKQGIGKSQACRILGEPWFSDHMPDPASKDASMAVRGLLIMEVPEMHAFASTRVEASGLKSFISRQKERLRLPYGRRISQFERICVFIGTTNEIDYIKDFTGARRFWPCKCTVVDLAGLKADRDQLFAEAVQRKRDGERHHPSSEEMELILKPEQDARVEYDEWEETIRDFLNAATNTGEDGFKIEWLYNNTGVGHGKPIDRRDAVRLSKILYRLGWVSKIIRKGDDSIRRWINTKNFKHQT